MRFAFGGGLLVATMALCGCSSPSVPSWAMGAPKRHYLAEKRMAQHSYQRKMAIAPASVHLKATEDGSYNPGTESKSDFEPFSEEWRHDQETKQIQFDSLLAICRGC